MMKFGIAGPSPADVIQTEASMMAERTIMESPAFKKKKAKVTAAIVQATKRAMRDLPAKGSMEDFASPPDTKPKPKRSVPIANHDAEDATFSNPID